MFLKKITIFSLMFFFWFSSVFADQVIWESRDTKNDVLFNNTSSAQWIVDSRKKEEWMSYNSQNVIDSDWSIKNISSDWKITNLTPQQTKTSNSSKFACDPSEDAICSDKFMIPTNDFSPGWAGLNKASSEKTINWFMTVLIKKLMVALGSLALLIMVVWAWFMIFAMWKDENLNKWKTIFKAWLISLAIALSSYYMVSFLSYILYTTN